MKAFGSASGGGLDSTAVAAIAAGSTLGLEQSLLANAGQPALTVLVVGITTNGKVQGSSLGNGNVITSYLSGPDFNAGIVHSRQFKSLGDEVMITGLSAGSIVTATQGFHGVTEVEGESASVARQATFPLMTYGLSFQKSFMFAFRGSTGSTNDRGVVFYANGPLANRVSIFTGSGGSIYGGVQEFVTLGPWESVLFDTDGNQEYIIEGHDAPIMAQSMSRAGGAALGGFTNLQNGRQWDARLVTPLTTDGFLAPRSGNASALFDGTIVDWYAFTGASGTLNNGVGFGPGSPVDIDSATPIGTGINAGFHNPAGYVRMRSNAPFTAYSGADASGGDAVQIYPRSAMSQRLAQPLYIRDDGSDSSEVGITIFSPYEGTARVYEGNTLRYTVPLTRGFTATTPAGQLSPAAGVVSNTTGNANNVLLVGDMRPGYIEADVPIGCVLQTIADTAGTDQIDIADQDGVLTPSILSVEDETMVFGWTAPEIAMESTTRSDGMEIIRVLDPNAGDSTLTDETWRLG